MYTVSGLNLYNLSDEKKKEDDSIVPREDVLRP